MMAKKVFKSGIKREKGFLYFVDKKGNVCKVKMARGGSGGRGGPIVLVKAGIKREDGHLYFIDKQGDVSAVAMSRGGRKKKSANKRKATKKKATKKKATKKKARR
jgi:hypothetical protein